MKCDSCNKEIMFLYFVGKSNVCNKCIAKHTVFKEVRVNEDGLLRKALRAFEINNFEDLTKITNSQVDKLATGAIKDKKGQTIKYKKNKGKALNVDNGDYLDPQTELDMSF